MGRTLQRNDTFGGANYQGCMSGIFQILDYHHWHVKRFLPNKKLGGKRRGRRNQRPEVILESCENGEAFIDADFEPLLVKPDDTDSVPARRRSAGKTRSIFPSEESHKSWILSFPLWLQRTNPVHHLEPSENCWDNIEANEKSDAKNALNESSKDVSDQKLGECADVLEIFKVNKDFFMKILQDPNNGSRDKFHGLGKSKSFPEARSRSVRPSTLKHKQNEVWFFLNKDKSGVATPTELGSAKQTEVSSVDSSKGFSSGRGWNQVVVSRFRDIKQKIKHALKESKREKNNKHRESCGDEISAEASEATDHIGSDDGYPGKPRTRRACSLNESLDKYTRLFDNAFGGESKFSHSVSLRLSTASEEDEEKPSSRSRKAYRRNLSLPDLDSLSSFLNIPKHQSSHSRLSMDIDYSDGFSTVGENENISEDNTREETCAARYPEDRESETKTCLSEGIESDHHSKCPQQEDCTDNEDLVFVRHILEISSLDQPLNPLLFKQLESFAEDEEITREDLDHQHGHYRLLFDLVNETLGDVNESSYTYFPRPRFQPEPTRERVFEEVWERTGSYLSLRPELDDSLDDVVARDLAQRDIKDWKSPQWDKEMVALELEDFIFDHLLDEVLCSLD